MIELNNFDAVQNNLLHHIINWLTDEILKCHVFKSEYNNSNFIGSFFPSLLCFASLQHIKILYVLRKYCKGTGKKKKIGDEKYENEVK